MKHCPECGKVSEEHWNGKNCPKCSSKLFRQKNPTYQKDYDLKRNAGEDRRQYARKRYDLKRDSINESRRADRKAHPEKHKRWDLIGHQRPKTRFSFSRKRAKERELEWTLSLEEYQKLIIQPCHYCNDLLGSKVTNCSGLDRLDDTKGYEFDNVVSCCRSCNVVRNDVLTSDETKQVIQFLLRLRKLIT